MSSACPWRRSPPRSANILASSRIRCLRRFDEKNAGATAHVVIAGQAGLRRSAVGIQDREDTFDLGGGLSMDYRARNFTQEDNYCRVDVDRERATLTVRPFDKRGEPVRKARRRCLRTRSLTICFVTLPSSVATPSEL